MRAFGQNFRVGALPRPCLVSSLHAMPSPDSTRTSAPIPTI